MNLPHHQKATITSEQNLDKVKQDFEKIIEKYNDFHFLNKNIITMTEKLYESNKYSRTIMEGIEI